jgi:hypothetical protein
MTGYDWELAYFVPTFIVWCFALYFCFVRRRENPKAALFLRLAILTRVLSIAIPYSFVFLIQLSDEPSMLRSPYLTWSNIGIRIVANAAMWILITMAVFARPKHYDDIGSAAFEDRSPR